MGSDGFLGVRESPQPVEIWSYQQGFQPLIPFWVPRTIHIHNLEVNTEWEPIILHHFGNTLRPRPSRVDLEQAGRLTPRLSLGVRECLERMQRRSFTKGAPGLGVHPR